MGRYQRGAPVLRAAATARRPDGMRVLIAAEPFAGMPAREVAGAVARGLERSGLAAPELLELPCGADEADLSGLFERERVHERLHVARALVIASREASERSLTGSALFELATRARQGGIPAYAIAGKSTLSAFDARLLDLQLVLRAAGPRALAGAGARVGALIAGAARPARPAGEAKEQRPAGRRGGVG